MQAAYASSTVTSLPPPFPFSGRAAVRRQYWLSVASNGHTCRIGVKRELGEPESQTHDECLGPAAALNWAPTELVICLQNDPP